MRAKVMWSATETTVREPCRVTLTREQKQLKRKLVAWYNGNCKRTRSVHARR